MKSINLKRGVLVALFCLAFVTFSNAQKQRGNDRKAPPTFAELVEELDANEDGKLAKDELKGPLKENFTEIDTDEDGFITEKEFKDAPKPKRKERRSN
ncbi:EF-hand domain-containing protein [Patiriisocius marinistellae]|nr:EF-hand domain-containing protein [Patiriisocius marinistellae]